MKKLNEIIKRRIKHSYDVSSLRFIFLDYDGTLVPFSDNPETALPENEIRELLAKAASINQNRVIIISGRDRRFLDNVFDGMKLTLVAEHGFFTREPGKKWSAVDYRSGNWKSGAREVLFPYLKTFPGSLLEEKESSIAWHYRKCTPSPTARQIVALKVLLQQEIKGSETELLQGNMVLEIKETFINKGIAASRLLHGHHPGFILAIGDDLTDEDLFQALPDEAFTIKVGNGKTAAKYFCADQLHVEELIRRLVSEPAT